MGQRKTLGSLCKKISSGKNKNHQQEGQYPVFGSIGEIARTDTHVYEGFRILVARVGANAGFVNAVEGKFDVSDNTLIVELDEGLNQRFAYHLLVNESLNQYAKGGGQPLITASQLKSLDVMIPPIERQQEIAELLDEFESLVNNASVGLPAEILARCKQYAYYRDKLLSFKEMVH